MVAFEPLHGAMNCCSTILVRISARIEARMYHNPPGSADGPNRETKFSVYVCMCVGFFGTQID